MPLYEYECAKCKERFTLLQGFSAAKTGYECPKCGMKLVLVTAEDGGAGL